VGRSCVRHNCNVEEIRFSTDALKHGVSKASVLYVAGSNEPTLVRTSRGGEGWFYLGRDAGGQELEVIIVDITKDGNAAWLVTHAMPTSFNKGKTANKMRERTRKSGR
jgi:hypothetical protein